MVEPQSTILLPLSDRKRFDDPPPDGPDSKRWARNRLGAATDHA